MITLTNTTITKEQVIGVPQVRIWGTEGTRRAEITLPTAKPNGEPLETLSLVIESEEFTEFYDNYTSDKYLVDIVFAKYGIEYDTSSISDITN